MTVMQAARPLPAWADAELSRDLPSLCAKGEGQAIEFKLDLPAQPHDIAKSIAAFASSNEGLLVYGVSDDGRIVGLSEAGDTKWRDRTQQRLLSAAKEIKPPVHPIIRWACVDGRIACVVKVEKGLEPIYYSNQRPIVRRGPSSRPAEPGEVEQIFRERYAGNSIAASMPSTKLIGRRVKQVLGLMNADRHDQLTVVDLARAMGLSTPADLEAVAEGHESPTFAILDQFSARFAVDKEWLTTGRGQPFRSPLEHQPLPESYLGSINAESPSSVYVVRSNSDVGECFIVVQTDEIKAWRLPNVWHVSNRVGGGGSRDLLSLYNLFRHWCSGAKQYSVLGRLVDPRLAKSVYNGEAYPGVVAYQPLSHWWDDLTDIEHKWTSRAESMKAYGKSFVAAQDNIREMLSRAIG
jgi:Putative DNA-binding domain